MDWRPLLPRVDSSSKIDGDCAEISVRFRSSKADVPVREMFCPVSGRSDYPHHSAQHAPYDRRAGMAFYFLQRAKSIESDVHDVLDAQREYVEAAAEESVRGRQPMGRRINKLRRLTKNFMVKWV